MAVSGNESNKIDMTNYNTFTQKNINTIATVTIDEAAVAGVTPDMANNIKAGLDSYVASINEAKKSLIDTVNAALTNKTIFQGEVNSALSDFVTSVDTTINTYISGLVAAEQDIVNSVAAAYKTNDSTMQTNINTQKDAMEGFSGTGQ